MDNIRNGSNIRTEAELEHLVRSLAEQGIHRNPDELTVSFQHFKHIGMINGLNVEIGPHRTPMFEDVFSVHINIYANRGSEILENFIPEVPAQDFFRENFSLFATGPGRRIGGGGGWIGTDLRMFIRKIALLFYYPNPIPDGAENHLLEIFRQTDAELLAVEFQGLPTNALTRQRTDAKRAEREIVIQIQEPAPKPHITFSERMDERARLAAAAAVAAEPENERKRQEGAKWLAELWKGYKSNPETGGRRYRKSRRSKRVKRSRRNRRSRRY
jgi:hypothetical protein